MALETTLVLPFFLVFFVAMSALIQIGIAEVALSSAVSEATKQIATHMYPAELLYQQYESSPIGQTLQQKIAQIKQLRAKLQQAEQWSDDYANLIPTPILDVMEFEQSQRSTFEQGMEEQYQKTMGMLIQPIVLHYADQFNETSLLGRDHLQIDQVVLPNFEQKDQAWFGIQAQYTVNLNLPFIKKSVTLRKTAYERVWIGG